MKKTLSIILAFVLIISALTPCLAANKVKSFSDVPSGAWYYSHVMRAVELGLVNGVTDPDANGVATFAPEDNMTQAEFIAVTMRAIAPEITKDIPKTTPWYTSYIELAQDMKIVHHSDLDDLTMLNSPITRQEMAHILANVIRYKAENPQKLIDPSNIGDWRNVDSSYQEDVILAYSVGMLAGYGGKDNYFGPRDNMTRGQACAVLNRILDKASRSEIPDSMYETKAQADPSARPNWAALGWGQEVYLWDESRANITFNVGDLHPTPKPGDIAINAKGEKCLVYLDEKSGVLMADNADIWTGCNDRGGVTVKVGIDLGLANGDYTNLSYDRMGYGELHTHAEWIKIAATWGKTLPESGTEGQVANRYWTWKSGEWCGNLGK